MPKPTYRSRVPAADRPLVWLHGAVKTPSFTAEARTEAGLLLRRLQRGDKLSLPHARPMPTLGPRCGELRIPDADATWRIMYRLDADAVVILAVFAKKTRATPKAILETCATRLKSYDLHTRGGK
jgi:phage-related protein